MSEASTTAATPPPAASTSPEWPSPSRYHRVWGLPWPVWATLMGLILIGAYLRLTGLDHFSLWFDEWLTLDQSTRDTWRETVGASGTHPPLLRVLVRASIAVFGDSQAFGGMDFALRLPVALLGIAGIPMIFAFARRYSRHDAVGLIAAGFYAMGPYGIYFGQEGRYYAGMMLFAAWAFHALALLKENPRSVWRQINMLLPLLLGIFNHHLAGIVFLLTFALVFRRFLCDFTREWYIGLPWFLAGLLFIPWFRYSMHNLESQARPWLGDFWSQLYDMPAWFFRGRLGIFHHWEAKYYGMKFYGPMGKAAGAIIVAGLLVHFLRRWRGLGLHSLFIVGTTLVVTGFLHDRVMSMRFFHPKYLAFLFPFVCLAIGEILVFLCHPKGIESAWASVKGAGGWVVDQWRRRGGSGVGVPLPDRRLLIHGVGWIWAVVVLVPAITHMAPLTYDAFQRIRPGADVPFYKERIRAAARWVEDRRDESTAVVVFEPNREQGYRAGMLRYYGLRNPLIVVSPWELEKVGRIWRKHEAALRGKKTVITVCAHCGRDANQKLQAGVQHRFKEQVAWRLFAGAEGLSFVGVFRP